MSDTAAEKILLIAHSGWRDGRLAPLLEAKGYVVEWRCPAVGDNLPGEDDAYAGAVVLGGVQSANDAESHPYPRREIDWIARRVASGRRYLGICLGAQLLARALDAKVAPHRDGVNEIGYYPIYPTPEGRDVIPPDLHVYHWHKEGFELPAGATLLARGDAFPHQAYRYGSSTYGLQFHPEVTAGVASAWVKSASDHLLRAGAQPAEHQLALAPRFDGALHDWFDRFLDCWLGRPLPAVLVAT
jgi:GMP synthase (glutamine-hydrolysing)